MSQGRVVFVIGPPGAVLRPVVDALAASPGVVTADRASADLSSVPAGQVPGVLLPYARDRDDVAVKADLGRWVLVDGTPTLSARVRELAAALPAADFVYVMEEPLRCLARLAAQHPDRDPQLIAATWKPEVTAQVAALRQLSPRRRHVVHRAQFVADAQAQARALTEALGLPLDRDVQLAHDWPVAPLPDAAGRAITELVGDVFASLSPAGPARTAPPQPVPAATQPAPDAPFESQFDAGMATVLQELGITLAVSTYQGGRLVLCRSDGQKVNTHLRMLPKPMGMALHGDVLAVGVARQIVRWRRHPEATGLVEDADAVFLPLDTRFTGDIAIHEMVYVDDELWFANTRFSCLATLDDTHSFVPRWKPPYISALAAEDRCHLNGIAVKDGRIASVTALGRTDTPAGWRDNKGAGGVILDVDSNEVVAFGLSMPHSPRWRNGELWVLESGRAALSRVDLARGQADTVAELPGFTRGLAFAGKYAFVGLSQVRDTVFRGLPVAQRADRQCGVIAVDLDAGAVAGRLVFTGVVEEVFDLQILPWRRPEVTNLDTPLLDSSFALPANPVR